MAQGTVIRVAPEQPTHAVYVLGTATRLDVLGSAPEDCTAFGISASSGVLVDVAHGPPTKKKPSGSAKWPLEPGLEVTVRMTAASTFTDDHKVCISYYGSKPTPVQALLYLTGVELSLRADVTRTGKAKPTGAARGQSSWTWGPRGQGAILLVNCDRDNPTASSRDCEDEEVLDHGDLKDMSLVTLSTTTPKNFSATHQLVLHVAKSEMDKVRVFQATRSQPLSRYLAVLGPQQPSHVLELPAGQHHTEFYAEGLSFPDAGFPGLISLCVSLLDTSNPELPAALVFQDRVTFRVAPWIMTPNTQPPQEVYVCRVLENEDFLKSVAALAKKARCKLTVCPKEQNMDDQWMQDEMEIGYTQAPHKVLPVVFDSPRDRGLKDFPIKIVMGPNFGYVTRGAAEEVTGLDSFGNLEVSPPVTVGKKDYPLGRILIGSSSFPSDESRDMHQALWDFLCAQQVQAPVKLYSDWLAVGHVDEFLSFVPALDRKVRRAGHTSSLGLPAAPGQPPGLLQTLPGAAAGGPRGGAALPGAQEKKTAANKGDFVQQETEGAQRLRGEVHRLEPRGAEAGAGPGRGRHCGHPAALQARGGRQGAPQGRRLLSQHGEYAGAGQTPGHPQALRPHRRRPLLPGGEGAGAAGAAGPALHLHRRLLLLPRPARRGALRHQRAPEALRLQVVAHGALSAGSPGALLPPLPNPQPEVAGALRHGTAGAPGAAHFPSPGPSPEASPEGPTRVPVSQTQLCLEELQGSCPSLCAPRPPVAPVTHHELAWHRRIARVSEPALPCVPFAPRPSAGG